MNNLNVIYGDGAHVWKIWTLFLNFVAIIIASIALPEGKTKSITLVVFSLLFVILGFYTISRSVELRGLLAWVQLRKKLGISSIYRRGDERNKELSDRISSSHNLKIMALSAESLFRHFRDAIITALVERNCNVQVLIAQEESNFVKEVEKLEGSNRKGEISTEIVHTKSRLKEIVKLAKEQSQRKSQPIGRIWVGTYNSAFRGSLIICDNSWGWYTPNLPPKRAFESVSLEIVQAPNGLLNDCISHFDAIWKMYGGQIREITPEETKI